MLAQLDLLNNWQGKKEYKNDVYLLPKNWDEKVASLHLPALGAQLTKLTMEQADCIGAIVGNIGHFDLEIDMAGLEGFPGIKVENIKPQVDRFLFPDGHGVIVLAAGRLLNLGCSIDLPDRAVDGGPQHPSSRCCSTTRRSFVSPSTSSASSEFRRTVTARTAVCRPAVSLPEFAPGGLAFPPRLPTVPARHPACA